ncbi:MAG: hypothetical protein HPY59_10900 [Anaerolineae bacterium]|nr:hypothetical protein [Anaerolineae bacterium]
MKTLTLHLESHDDVASTIDKISWGRARRFLLVWPKNSRLMRSRLDLVLIQRHCIRLGAQLGIITQDPDVEEDAKQLGIPVFHSVSQANLSPWRRKRSKRRSFFRRPARTFQRNELEAFFKEKVVNLKKEGWYRKPVFASGVLSVFVLLLFFLPSANITLALAESEQNLRLQVWASPDIPAPNLSGGIPTTIGTVIVEGQDQIETTGSVSFPDRFAVGQIVLTNLTDQVVIAPAGTVVLTLGDPAIQFLTEREVRVPAGIGESAAVAIRAQQPGRVGNVAAGQIRAIAGLIGSNLLVENPEPTSGGADIMGPAPSEQDYENLRARLLSSLEQTAFKDIVANAGTDKRLLPQTLKLEKVLEEERQPAIGQAGDRLILRLRVEYSAWYIAPEDLETMVSTVLDAGLVEEYVAVPGSLQILETTEPVIEQERVGWEVLASRKIRSDLKKEEVITAILGKSRQAAEELISRRLNLKSQPIIRFYPGWWPRLPYLPFQIRVDVQ